MRHALAVARSPAGSVGGRAAAGRPVPPLAARGSGAPLDAHRDLRPDCGLRARDPYQPGCRTKLAHPQFRGLPLLGFLRPGLRRLRRRALALRERAGLHRRGAPRPPGVRMPCLGAGAAAPLLLAPRVARPRAHPLRPLADRLHPPAGDDHARHLDRRLRGAPGPCAGRSSPVVGREAAHLRAEGARRVGCLVDPHTDALARPLARDHDRAPVRARAPRSGPPQRRAARGVGATLRGRGRHRAGARLGHGTHDQSPRPPGEPRDRAAPRRAERRGVDGARNRAAAAAEWVKLRGVPRRRQR